MVKALKKSSRGQAVSPLSHLASCDYPLVWYRLILMMIDTAMLGSLTMMEGNIEHVRLCESDEMEQGNLKAGFNWKDNDN